MIRRIGWRYGSSKAWINRHVNDGFVQKSVKEGMRSRSAYKLQELNEKHGIIRPSDVVVDLGAAPGGWSLVVSKLIRPAQGGMLVSLDLLPMEPVPQASILCGDFTAESTQLELKRTLSGRAVNVVLSDMLGNSTGSTSTDHYRSMDLVRKVMEFSTAVLSSKGVMLCKYIRGEDEKEMLDSCRSIFQSVKVVKPAASRNESAEIYLLAKGLKSPPPPASPSSSAI